MYLNESSTSNIKGRATRPVKNDIANQAHTVEMAVVCLDTTGDGCIGAFGFGDLRIDVFQP